MTEKVLKKDCDYGIWCDVCKTSYTHLSWEDKQKLNEEHNHPKNTNKKTVEVSRS